MLVLAELKYSCEIEIISSKAEFFISIPWDLNILLNQMKRSPVKEIYAVNNEIFINFKNFNYQRNKVLRNQKNIYQYDYRNNIFSITVWNANVALEIAENFKKLVKISY